jgi:hypothetical protein
LSQSAIRYNQRTRYIQDAQLGAVIQCVFIVVDQNATKFSDEIGWLLHAIAEWWSDFEELPPGLKDIELDKWLTKGSRKEIFENLLEDALKQCDESLKDEIFKWMEILRD